MEQYWIRNRGRVQGPFNIDRIQGLMRRGRFNRHFHVSEDKKSWYPASDFPELFEGVGRSQGGGGGGNQDEVFQSGGSPFDEDYDAAPPSRSQGRPAPAQSAFGADDDDDDEDWEDDDEDWEDDDDDSEGLIGGLVGWVEANTKGLVVVLLLILGVLGWFVFGRESFAQDKEDLDYLIAVNSRISMAHNAGEGANAWTTLADTIEVELAPLVERLEETASAKDHVKQELLFSARDDIPRMFKELPQGNDDAQKRIQGRFALIERMISTQSRQDNSPLTPSFAAPVQKNMPQDPALQGEIPDELVEPTTEQSGGISNRVPGATMSGAAPKSTIPRPSATQPAPDQPYSTPSMSPAGSVPGRPKPGG